jgi:hypothetical protein
MPEDPQNRLEIVGGFLKQAPPGELENVLNGTLLLSDCHKL